MTEELWLGLGKWRKGVSRSRQHPLKCAFWLRLVCRPAGSGQVRQAKEVAAGTRAWHRRAEKWWGWLKARRWVKRCQVAVFSALHILHWDHFFLLRNTTRKKLVGKAIKDENVKLKQEDSPPASFKMFLYSPLRFASVGTSFLDKNNQVWGRCFFFVKMVNRPCKSIKVQVTPMWRQSAIRGRTSFHVLLVSITNWFANGIAWYGSFKESGLSKHLPNCKWYFSSTDKGNGLGSWEFPTWVSWWRQRLSMASCWPVVDLGSRAVSLL